MQEERKSRGAIGAVFGNHAAGEAVSIAFDAVVERQYELG